MKALRLLLLLCAPAAAFTQADDTPPERSFIAIDQATGAWSFNWWGVEGRTYFIQNSDLNLANWTYWPVIEQGADAPVSYGFWPDPPPERIFLRLRYTEQPVTDPYAADFDGDGIPSGWELEHGLDPFNASDAASLSAGISPFDLYQQSQDGANAPLTQNPVHLAVFTP